MESVDGKKVHKHALVERSTMEIEPIRVGFPLGSPLGSPLACPELVGTTLNEPPVEKDHQGSADHGTGSWKLSSSKDSVVEKLGNLHGDND